MPFPYPTGGAAVPLFLAPMAGVSESPFRRLCRAWGADVVVTEFLSAEGIRRENEATISKLRFNQDEHPIGVQIFGAEPDAMREAAAAVTDVFQPDFIDINFGCPVKKVVRRNGGSGCLRDLDLVQQVIRAVISGTHLPVTCKIRSGWSEEMRDPVKIGLKCQEAGVRAIALHPRTRTQMYTGAARWEEIAQLKAALEIPVIGNGDIKTAADAHRMHDDVGQHTDLLALRVLQHHFLGDADGLLVGRQQVGVDRGAFLRGKRGGTLAEADVSAEGEDGKECAGGSTSPPAVEDDDLVSNDAVNPVPIACTHPSKDSPAILYDAAGSGREK